ncbi:MAG TPA: hypothetical protein VJ986_11835, partial [Gaiellaceae bacterium]|nr:hypothetical protein [Gaiellaceae bacterium]
SLKINQASGTYSTASGTVNAAALDWTTALNLNRNASFGEKPGDQLVVGGTPFDLSGATVQASGTAAVSLGNGLVSGTVSFSISQTTVNVDVNGDGCLDFQTTCVNAARGPPGPDLQNATLTTIGLRILSPGLTIGAGGVGFTVASGTLAVAVVTPSAADKAAGDTRSWLAVDASISNGSFTGVSGLTVTVDSLAVRINKASGLDAAGDTNRALDWTKAIAGGVSVTTPTPTGPVTQTIDYTSQLFGASGALEIDVFGFLSGHVAFTFQTQTASLTASAPITSGTLTTMSLTLTNGFVGVPGGIGFSIGSGTLSLATLTPTATTDTRRWLAVTGTLQNASFEGVTGLTLTVNSLSVTINQGSDSTGATVPALDWQTAFTSPIAGLPTAGGLTASGSATIDLFGLVSGTISFTVAKTTVDVASLGLTGANLLTLTLTGSIFLGVNGFGVDVNNASLKLAILKPADPADKRSWLAIDASVGPLSFQPLAGISFQLASLEVRISRSPVGAPLDWTTIPSAGITFHDANVTELFAAGAVMSIDNFIYASGDFAFTTGSDIYVTPKGSTTSVDVSLLQIGVSNGNLFAGTGSPITAAGAFDPQATGAVGVGLSGVQFAVAIMTERTTTSPVTYTALKGSGAAALYGVSGITLEGTLEVQANLATDKANPSRAPPAIDFTQLSGGGLAVPTGPSSSVLLDFSGGVVKASGSVTLALGGFAYVTGKFAFQQGTTGTPITLSNGHTGTASVTTVGVSDAYAFFGTGGPYWDSNGDGVVSPGETPSAGAMGLAIGHVSLALALVKADAGQFTSDGFTSGFALEASGSVSLVGISAITASIQSVKLSLNQATSTSGAAVDWKASFGGTGLSVDTGGGNSTLLDQTGPIFQASGSITIAIGGFVYLQGNVAFTKGAQKTVTLAGGGTDTVDVLTVGASGVTAFVGVNGPPATSSSAIGLSLTGVNFALALMKSTAVPTRSYYALEATVASATVVGVTGLTVAVTNLDIQVNGASDSASTAAVPVVDYVASYGTSGLAVDAGGGNTIALDFTNAFLRAAGQVTLGIGGVSVSAGVAFERSTRPDGSAVIAIGVNGVSVTLGSKTFGDAGSSGLFVITPQGVSGEVTLHNVGFSVGDSTNGASFTSDLGVLFNTSTQAVNESLTLADGSVATLSAPAGPYFRVSATNTAFSFAVAGISYSLTGDFQLEQITVAGVKVIRVAVANVTSTFTIGSVGTVSLAGGQGGLIIFPDGIAGTLSGQFSVTGGSLPVQAGATVTLELNTTVGRNVNETITIDGQPILVNVLANTWKLGFTNLSVSFGDFLSLSGNFTTGSGANGSTIYGATNVEIFFGDGPYRLADGSVNPDAIGLVISGGSVGAVKYTNGTYAIYASGTASFVGIPGISVSGTLTVKINQTGHAVNDTIQLPSGASPASVTMPFTTGAYVTEVDGTNITISAAGVVTLSGDVKFLMQPSGRVDVAIPNATVGVTIPGVSGPAVSISGDARFSFGGGLGFQLDRLTVDGFSILGHGITLPPPIVHIPPTAALVSPYANDVVDVNTLNAQGYIEVRFTDQSGRGLNVGSITDTASELTLTGTSATGVTLDTPTQVDPTNDPGLFRYAFSGQFTAPASGFSTVGFQIIPNSFADANGTTNTAASGQFFLYTDPPANPNAPVVPTVQVASPMNGATIGSTTFGARPYIDLAFSPGVSGGVVSLDPSFSVTLSGAGAAHLATTLDASACAPVATSKTTYRCNLSPAAGYTTTTMFTGGEIDVAVAAGTWHVTPPAGSASTTPIAGAGGSGRFTVSTSDPNAGSTSDPISLGPLTLQGAKVALAGTTFDKSGMLTLTVAISVDNAQLAFGAGGFSSELHGVVAKFDIQVDLMKALQSISDPSGLLAAFSVPGKFSLDVQSLALHVPDAVDVTASGIHVSYDPAYKAADHGGAPQKLVEVDGAVNVSFPLLHVGAELSSVTTPNGCTVGTTGCTLTTPALTIYDNGFQLGNGELIFAPAGGINFGSILRFKDLRIGVQNFGMTFNPDGSISFHGGPNGSAGLTLGSGGVQFLPGKPISGSITDGPDANTDAVTATFTFDSSGHFQAFKFNADQLTIKMGDSVLTLKAQNFTINTGAGPNDPLVSFDSVSAQVKIGSLVIGGEARNFQFNGDGSFHTRPGFGVFLSVGSATGSSFKWPSWLPIKIDSIGITWPDIQADPTNFTLTLSASVTGIKGISGLTFSGEIQGIQIDVGKLLKGEFPIVGIDSLGVGVHGNVFGGKLDAALLGGILKLDSAGNLIPDGNTTTPVAQRIFYAGVEGGFSFAGESGFTIRFALSQLGPLGVFINVNTPTGILLDPDTGIAINNFAGGVQFFHTLPSITDPMQLRNAAFSTPTNGVTVDNWLSTIKQQVVAQARATSSGQSGWAAAFTSPMTITGSADIFDEYTSEALFNGQVTLEFSTDGKILVIGQLNFAANNISISGKLYADLSKISQGSATVLFLADVPDQVRVLSLYGKLQMGFKNAQGQQVAFTVPNDPPTSPTATLAEGATLAAGTLNGRGFVDVSYAVPTGDRLTASSITDLAPEFTIASTTGSIQLDSTQAPILVDAATNTYRYWTIANNAGGTITLTPIDSAWAFVQTASGNTVANPLDAASAFSNVDTSHLATHYLDVGLAPTANQTVDTSTLGAGDFTLSQGGSPIPVAIDSSLTPTAMPGTNVYRYYVTGAFPLGKIDVTFPAGAFSDSADLASAAGSGSFTVVEPTTTVVGPFSGSSTDIAALNSNDRFGYIDVSFAVPAGDQLNAASITDGAPEFTVSASTGSISLDASQAPVLVDATTNTYRYWVFANQPAGVTLTPIAQSWTFTDSSGATVDNPTTAAAAFSSVDASHAWQPLYVDLAYTPPTGTTVDYQSLYTAVASGNGPSITLPGSSTP